MIAIIVDEVTEVAEVMKEEAKEEDVDAEVIKQTTKLLTIIVRIMVRNHKNKTTKLKITMLNKSIQIKSQGDNAIKKNISKKKRMAIKK